MDVNMLLYKPLNSFRVRRWFASEFIPRHEVAAAQLGNKYRLNGVPIDDIIPSK